MAVTASAGWGVLHLYHRLDRARAAADPGRAKRLVAAVEALRADGHQALTFAVLGHKADFGPKMPEAGSITVPLKNLPQPGETMTVQFGLQTGAGCLPHPLIGLDGSRFVNGGEATFTDVKVG